MHSSTYNWGSCNLSTCSAEIVSWNQEPCCVVETESWMEPFSLQNSLLPMTINAGMTRDIGVTIEGFAFGEAASRSVQLEYSFDGSTVQRLNDGATRRLQPAGPYNPVLTPASSMLPPSHACRCPSLSSKPPHILVLQAAAHPRLSSRHLDDLSAVSHSGLKARYVRQVWTCSFAALCAKPRLFCHGSLRSPYAMCFCLEGANLLSILLFQAIAWSFFT